MLDVPDFPRLRSTTVDLLLVLTLVLLQLPLEQVQLRIFYQLLLVVLTDIFRNYLLLYELRVEVHVVVDPLVRHLHQVILRLSKHPESVPLQARFLE